MHSHHRSEFVSPPSFAPKPLQLLRSPVFHPRETRLNRNRWFTRGALTIMACALVALAIPAKAVAASAIALTSSTATWAPVLKGANFDFINDQQATAFDLELVGNASHSVLYTYYEDNGTGDDTDDFIYFRVRLAGSKASSTSSFTSGYVFIGMDINGDGAIDLFLSITQRTTNDQKISVWSPGSGANTSPSTTTIRDEMVVANLKSLTSYVDFSPVTTTNDPSATDLDLNTTANETSFGGNTNNLKDHFLTFKFPFSNSTAAIDSLKEAAAAKGIALTKSTAMRYLLATSTQSNALNSDLVGYNGGTKSSLAFDQVGAFSPTLSPSNIPPQITSNGGGSAAGIIVSSGTAVTTVTATDANSDPITYSISGGADAALFSINATTGALAFLSAPAPGTYVVQVRASDAISSTSQTLTITVPDPSDVTPPTVTNVTSSTINGYYNTADAISIQVVFTEPVQVTGTPQLTLETGGTDRIASYVSGTGSNTLYFTYTVQSGDTSGDLDYASTTALAFNGGTIRDGNSNNAVLTLASPGASASLGANKNLVIDTTAPVYSAGSSSASGATVVLAFTDTYQLDSTSAPTTAMFTNAKIGNSNVAVSSVRVDAAANTVTLILSASATNGQAVTLTYTDPSSADDVYAVQDLAGNDAATFAVSLTATGDSTAPQVVGVSSYDVSGIFTNGHYGASSVIPIQVEFSELVNVTGTPTLTLETGATDRVINYASGTGTNVLTFNYTVQAGDTASDLDYASIAALVLNGGTIRDAASNNATLALPLPGATGSLGASNDITVDTTAPTFSSAKVVGATLTVYFSDTNGLDSTNPPATTAFAVTVAGASRSVSSLIVGGSERYALLTLASAVTTGQAVTVAYTDPSAGNDAAALQDMAGNDLATFSAQSVSNLTGDAAAPTLVSINDNDADNAVAPNSLLTYTVAFNEDIDATTVSAVDFSNAGTAVIAIGGVTETSSTSGVFSVEVSPTTTGTIILQVSADTVIRDLAGNALVTTSALQGGVETVTVSGVSNQSPLITSNGGGASASIGVTENTVAVTTVAATDPEGQSINYTITGGADAAAFTLNSSSGVLMFVAAPNFEAPASAAGTNVYTVIVQASDGSGGNVTQTLTVTVTNANETPALGAVSHANGAYNTAITPIVLVGSDIDAGDTLTYSATGLPAGVTVSGATISGTPLAAGAASVTVRVTDAGGLFAEQTFTLTIAKATPTITWSNPAAVVYGTALSGTQLNATANVAGTFVYSPASGSVLGAGSRTLGVSFTPADSANFDSASTSVTLSVAPASLTVTASDRTRAYGAANPTPGYSTTGFVNGETTDVLAGAPAITTAATASSPVGTYAITAGQGTLGASNYTFTFVNGTLTVTKAPLTFTANNKSRAFGSPNPALTYAISGLVNGETSAVLAGAPELATTATSSSPAGSYPITIAAGSLAATNYSFSFTAGTLTIGASQSPVITSDDGGAEASVSVAENSTAVTTVTATDPEGQAISFSISGGADAAKFTLHPTSGELSFSSAPNFEAPGSAADSNVYTVIVQATDSTSTSVTQTITVTVVDINEAPSLAALSDVDAAYQSAITSVVVAGTDVDAGDTLTYSATGLPAGVTLLGATISGTPTNAGTAIVTIRVTDAAGLFAERNFALNVAKATPTIAWSNPAPIVYGTALGSGQLNAVPSVPGTLTYNPASGTVLAAGVFTLTATLTPNDITNYNSATASVTLSVTTSAPTIPWSDPTTRSVAAVVTTGATTALPPVVINAHTPVVTAPTSIAINSNGPVRISDIAGPITVSPSLPPPINVTLSVVEGALSLPNLQGATLVAGTGFNDSTLVLTGTAAQLNAALEGLLYEPARNGPPQSTDVLKVTIAAGAGVVGEISIHLFVQRNALGGAAAAVNLTALVPPNKTLVSTEATQWDRTLITSTPSIAADGTMSFVSVDGQNGGVSRTTISIRLTFSDGTTADVEVPVTIYHPLLEVVSDVSSPTQLNPQTSLYEQKVRIVNTTPFELIAFRVTVPNLPASVRLESASGIDTSGAPYITGMTQLAPGAEVLLTLEYFSTDAKPFANPFVKLELNGSGGMATPTGLARPVERMVTAYRGRTYVEFTTIAGKTYWVQYRDSDNESWQTSSVPLLGTGTRVHWMDEGQPKTSTVPTGSRRYRLIEAAPMASIPGIVREPLGATTRIGGEVALTVSATGEAPLSYQWYRDGEVVSGATDATLSLRALKRGDAGRYQVLVRNAHGVIASKIATVALSDVTPAALSHFSIRARAERGERELHASLTLAGTGPAKMLLRAAGQSLGAFGVAGAIADARLSLEQDGAVLATNEIWSSDSAASLTAETAAAMGAFAFPAGSHDAALLRNLVSGTYALRVAPTASSGGITLLEAFDASAVDAKSARVSGISVRAIVGAGDRAFVGGFTVTGGADVRLLVRAVGPGLKQRGITSGASDPRLSIFRSGSNVAVATNDNWSAQPDGHDLSRLFAALGASALADGAKDAALVISLAPGSYTFTADVADGVEGLALLEFYAIDL